MITSLKKIRAHNRSWLGLNELLIELGKTEADDEPLSIATILDIAGLDVALWCLQAVKGYDREIRLYAVWCARRVERLMDDPRSIAAIYIAERYARGEVNRDKLLDAGIAAANVVPADPSKSEAARAAEATAARVPGWAAITAAESAECVYWTAAAKAPSKTKAAEMIKAGEAEREAQEAELRRICEEIDNV